MAAAINTIPQFPKIGARFVNEQGFITAPWQQLLLDLWRKVETLQAANAELTSKLEAATQDAALLVPPQTQIAVS